MIYRLFICMAQNDTMGHYSGEKELVKEKGGSKMLRRSTHITHLSNNCFLFLAEILLIVLWDFSIQVLMDLQYLQNKETELSNMLGVVTQFSLLPLFTVYTLSR